MPAFDPTLQDKVARSAAEFSRDLEKLAGFYESKFSEVIRKTVLDLFASIVRRSPVDTGAYRASHGIANHNPKSDEGVFKYGYRSDVSGAVSTDKAMEKALAWTWKSGDGTIYIFNNLPYAEPIENGHSGQAPQGVYRLAMAEIQAIMQKQIARLSGVFK